MNVLFCLLALAWLADSDGAEKLKKTKALESAEMVPQNVARYRAQKRGERDVRLLQEWTRRAMEMSGQQIANMKERQRRELLRGLVAELLDNLEKPPRVGALTELDELISTLVIWRDIYAIDREGKLEQPPWMRGILSER